MMMRCFNIYLRFYLEKVYNVFEFVSTDVDVLPQVFVYMLSDIPVNKLFCALTIVK